MRLEYVKEFMNYVQRPNPTYIHQTPTHPIPLILNRIRHPTSTNNRTRRTRPPLHPLPPLRPRTPHLLKTSKLTPTPLPQPLQHRPHLGQLCLQTRPRIVVRPLVQLLVDLALHLTRAVRGILTQCLGYEFYVESGLHKFGEGVALTELEGFEEFTRGLLEEVGEDLGGEGGGGGRDLGVD